MYQTPDLHLEDSFLEEVKQGIVYHERKQREDPVKKAKDR